MWQTNCVIVRGTAASGEEVFVIDSPVLPEELTLLAGLPEQVGFALPSALMATHADWDHLLGRLAFPDLELGLAESSLERLRAHPGSAQRELGPSTRSTMSSASGRSRSARRRVCRCPGAARSADGSSSFIRRRATPPMAWRSGRPGRAC